MKDLVFLLITLGLITFGMMLAQNQYRAELAEPKDRSSYHYKPPASPTPSASPNATGQEG